MRARVSRGAWGALEAEGVRDRRAALIVCGAAREHARAKVGAVRVQVDPNLDALRHLGHTGRQPGTVHVCVL